MEYIGLQHKRDTRSKKVEWKKPILIIIIEQACIEMGWSHEDEYGLVAWRWGSSIIDCCKIPVDACSFFHC